MDETIKTDWTGDLRSGNFHQGGGKLHQSKRQSDGTERHEFCCLGVLCERAVEAGVVERVVADGREDVGTTTYAYVVPGSTEQFVHYPPMIVAEWAGLTSDNPVVNIPEGTFPDGTPEKRKDVIANVNDDGAKFDKIADIIETQL